MCTIMCTFLNYKIRLVAEIKLWHRIHIKTKKHHLYIDLVYGDANITENRKQIHTKILLDKKYWDSKKRELKRTHPNYEVLSHTIRELRDRIEKGIDRFQLGQINRDQLEANISGKSNYSSIDDYIETEIKNTRKGATYNDYRTSFKTFKKYVGYESKKMKFSDVNYNLISKFKKSYFNSEIGKKNKSNNSYNSHLTKLQAVYNDAYENQIVFDRLKIPKKLKLKKTKTKWIPATPEDFIKAIENVDSLRQWESLAMWLLAFCCRGMYWADFTTIKSTNVRDNKLYNTWCSDDSIYLMHERHKTQDSENVDMLIKIDKYPTMELFRLIKLSFAKRYFKTRPEIVPSINDWIGIYRYNLNENPKIHAEIINSYQKALREVWAFPLKTARKTFNNIAGECEITPKICDLLIGHSPDSRINQMSYTDYRTSEYARQIEEAHNKVLKAFKTDLLMDKLQSRLDDLSKLKRNKIYSWILNSHIRTDSAGNLYIDRKLEDLEANTNEIERTGFTEYFKDQEEYLNTLTGDND